MLNSHAEVSHCHRCQWGRIALYYASLFCSFICFRVLFISCACCVRPCWIAWMAALKSLQVITALAQCCKLIDIDSQVGLEGKNFAGVNFNVFFNVLFYYSIYRWTVFIWRYSFSVGEKNISQFQVFSTLFSHI